jgi:hypothetical protein
VSLAVGFFIGFWVGFFLGKKDLSLTTREAIAIGIMSVWVVGVVAPYMNPDLPVLDPLVHGIMGGVVAHLFPIFNKK